MNIGNVLVHHPDHLYGNEKNNDKTKGKERRRKRRGICFSGKRVELPLV